MRFFLVLILYMMTLYALEIRYANSELYNGQVLYLDIKKEPLTSALNIYFKKKAYPVYPHPKDTSRWYALVPVAYDTKPGTYRLYVEFMGKKGLFKERIESIMVKRGSYKTEHLHVDPAKIKLSKKDQKRANREYEEAAYIYSHSAPKLLARTPFKAAMHSFITSPFGTERLFNGVRKSFHSGVDYRAKTPLPVLSVNSGIVKLAKERFFAGGSVIIDHGQGIFSCYYHMSKFFVKKNESVDTLQKLGLSGATGRVSGPHLHYSMKLHSVTVDPLQFTEILNSYLF